ncbi:MAG: sulfotransferase [Gammaproteobacteria bacterium]|nr:sulfotransferase [Gammaproteobacteria bacterium]
MDTRAEKLWQRGMVHFRQGNMEAAKANFEAFLAREPGSGPGHFRLSLAEARRGRYASALDFGHKALAIDPDRIETLAHLARCHLGAGQPERARARATQALAMPRDNPVVLDSLGVVMTRLDEQSLALELFDQAIALAPGQASMHFNRAMARKQFGLPDAAEEDLETCLSLDPSHAKAHWMLAGLRTQDLVGNHIVRLRQQLDRSREGNQELLALSLFKELDDLANTEQAASALARGIAARGPRGKSAGHHQAALVDALVARCGERFVRTPGGVRGEDAPVFIVGMPRSGVGLLGSLLSRHPKIFHLGSQSPFSRLFMSDLGSQSTRTPVASDVESAIQLDFAAVGARYLSEVIPRGARNAIVCESQPLNYLQCGFIARALPGARFLHVGRDPVDNCVSILGHAGGDSSIPGGDPGELAAYYGDYLRLMQHWHDVLPGRMMDITYESLVDKPEMILRVVCSFLGIRYASPLRLGLKLHQRSLGRGRRYLPQLPRLEFGLEPPIRPTASPADGEPKARPRQKPDRRIIQA